jgi:hypothetical protein
MGAKRLPPDLVKLADLWADLPKKVRVSILALAEASLGGQ